jgi:hypothetical protein
VEVVALGRLGRLVGVKAVALNLQGLLLLEAYLGDSQCLASQHLAVCEVILLQVGQKRQTMAQAVVAHG